MSTTSQRLTDLTNQIAFFVAQGENIIARTDGLPVPGSEEAIELQNIQAHAGAVLIRALQSAKDICQQNGVSAEKILDAYVQQGIYLRSMRGAITVANSILTGKDQGFVGHFPIGHLRGIVAALRFVLNS